MHEMIFLLLLALNPYDKFYYKPVKPPNPVKAPYKKINIQHYKINLNLDFAGKQIDGSCGIKLLPNGAPIDTVYLDLVNLTADSVKTEGGTKLYFSHDGSILTIGLDRLYNPAELVSIYVYYHGHPTAGVYFYENSADTHTESEDSRFWFPCNDIPSDKAELGVEQYYRTLENINLQSNGKLVEKTVSGGYAYWHYKSDYPIATYLIAFSAADFDSLIQEHKGMPVTHYFYKSSSSQRKEQLSTFPDMITLCETFYGTYPFRNERLGCMEFITGGGMEHQTMISMSDWAFSEQWVIFHELSHQWWGDMVTCGTWYDTWLNESWATYSEMLYYHFMDNQDWLDVRHDYLLNALRIEDWSKSMLDCFGCERLVYGKGAFIMEMLRLKLEEKDSIYPESIFFNSLRRYGSEYKYLSAVTEDFIRSWEQSTNQNLRSFLVQWIGEIGHPVIDYVVSPYSTGVELNLSQVQRKSHPKASIFEFPLEIRFKDASHDTTVEIDFTKETYEGKIELGFQPAEWTFDPRYKLLAEYKKGTGFKNSYASSYKPVPLEIKLYPNPARNYFHLSTRGNERNLKGRLEIYDITGRKLENIDISRQLSEKSKARISLQNIPQGIYIVSIKLEGRNVITKRIAVIK